MQKIMTKKMPFSSQSLYKDAATLLRSMNSKDYAWRALYLHHFLEKLYQRDDHVQEQIHYLLEQRDSADGEMLDQTEGRFLHYAIYDEAGVMAIEIGIWFEDVRGLCRVTAQVKAERGPWYTDWALCRRAMTVIKAQLPVLNDVQVMRSEHPEIDFDDEAGIAKWVNSVSTKKS